MFIQQSSPSGPLSFICRMLAACLVLLLPGRLIAQKADSTDKVRITISNSGEFVFNKTDSGEFNKFIHDVVLLQGTDTLYCDSLYQNNTTKNFEAFGHVKIAQQGGTQGTSNYLRYTTEKKLAYMSGDVHLTDGKNKLACEVLTYNLGTKVAVYDQWGTLHNDSTTVTSKSGIYNSGTKDARFTTNVIVTDPQYNIRSEDMVYNTESKVTRFYSRSTVTRDTGRSVLQTTNGTYDGKNGVAHFTGHSSIWNDGQYIEGDTLYYNKITSYGLANGNVISMDTAQHATLYCGHAEYFTKKRVLWATIKPVLAQANGKDTLYLRADTFYSAPMLKMAPGADTATGKTDDILPAAIFPAGELYLKEHSYFNVEFPKGDSLYPAGQVPLAGNFTRDTAYRHAFSAGDTAHAIAPVAQPDATLPAKPAAKTAKAAKNTKKTTKALPATAVVSKKRTTNRYEIPHKAPMHISTNGTMADTAATDTTAPLYFIGYHHVLIFSDSLQGKCDSVCYTRADSTIRMMYNPIAWAHNSQITGDTILMRMDSASLKSMYVPTNAFVISQSGPAKARLFNQVQGRTLTAWFHKNAIDSMLVFPEAESIYYPTDEKGAYLGVDQSKSVIIRTYFDDQKIMKIKLEREPHVVMTPLDKADLPNMKLSRYKWLIDQRPKDKDELFR